MLVASISHGEKILKHWSWIPWLAQDTETVPKPQWADDKESTLIHHRHQIKIFSACFKGVSYSFPTNVVSAVYPTAGEWAELFEWYFMECNPKIVSVFHNANYDIRVMRDMGWPVFRQIWDTMISSWMANANIDKGLKARAPIYGRHIRDTKTIDFNNLAELSDYAEGDVVVTDEIFQMHTKGVVARPKTLTYLQANGKFTAPVKNQVGDYELRIKSEQLTPFDRTFLRKQEFPVLISTIECEKNGVPLNTSKLHTVRLQMDKDLQAVVKRIYRQAGKKFNLNASKQKVQVLQDLGLNLTRKTKGGDALSADFEAMVGLRGQHAIIDDFIEYAKVEKLRSVYIGGAADEGLEYYYNPKTGCIHPNLNTVGAVTGRFSSCVRGDTLLETSRGTFRFDEYLPEEGDSVRTHLGRWKPVLRKIYKGVAPMYRVRLSNGAQLVCTAAHRVFSANCWISVAKLTVGSKVWSYEYIKNSDSRLDSGSAGSQDLSLGQTAHDERDSENLQAYSPYRSVDSARELAALSPESRAGVALLPQQDGKQEPYAGQEWFPASQPYRGHRGRTRLPSTESEWKVLAGSPACLFCRDRDDQNAERIRASSHRREQAQQRAIESGSVPRFGTQGASREEVEVSEITPLAAAGVWDIEVADDHSYEAQGFLNHNSSPNLQNIPARNDRYGLKQCFEAPKGELFICMDYSQIELRIMALLSKDPLMTQVLNDPKGDIHLTTAEKMLVPRDPVAKQCNFLLIFGGGGRVLAQRLKLEGQPTTDDQGFRYVDDFNNTYTYVKPYREHQFDFHRQHGFIYLLTGRRRVIENIDSTNRYKLHMAETQLANNQIQGSAQDMMKALIVRSSIHRQNMDAIISQTVACPRDHLLILKDYAVKVEKFRRDFKLAKLRWRLQVHDEVLYTCDKYAALDCGNHISEMMSWRHYFPPITDMSVVLRGDGGIGETWGLAKKPKDPAMKIHSVHKLAA